MLDNKLKRRTRTACGCFFMACSFAAMLIVQSIKYIELEYKLELYEVNNCSEDLK